MIEQENISAEIRRNKRGSKVSRKPRFDSQISEKSNIYLDFNSFSSDSLTEDGLNLLIKYYKQNNFHRTPAENQIFNSLLTILGNEMPTSMKTKAMLCVTEILIAIPLDSEIINQLCVISASLLSTTDEKMFSTAVCFVDNLTRISQSYTKLLYNSVDISLFLSSFTNLELKRSVRNCSLSILAHMVSVANEIDDDFVIIILDIVQYVLRSGVDDWYESILYMAYRSSCVNEHWYAIIQNYSDIPMSLIPNVLEWYILRSPKSKCIYFCLSIVESLYRIQLFLDGISSVIPCLLENFSKLIPDYQTQVVGILQYHIDIYPESILCFVELGLFNVLEDLYENGSFTVRQSAVGLLKLIIDCQYDHAKIMLIKGGFIYHLIQILSVSEAPIACLISEMLATLLHIEGLSGQNIGVKDQCLQNDICQIISEKSNEVKQSTFNCLNCLKYIDMLNKIFNPTE